VRTAGRVDTTFVGRAEELGLFNRTLDQVLGGRRQILMPSGEPGSGKSRCAEAFAHAAEDQGALVVWGRCYEEPGAPEADQLAGRLSMAALSRDIDRVLRGATDDRAFPDGLTVREIDVLRLITIGRSNKGISKALTISLNTVATHVRSILNKTGCANRTEAAAYAMRNELQLVSTAEHPTRQPAQPSP